MQQDRLKEISPSRLKKCSSQHGGRYMSRREVLEELFTEDVRPSERTWQRFERKGLVPFTQMGKRKLYNLQKVADALDNLEVNPHKSRKRKAS